MTDTGLNYFSFFLIVSFISHTCPETRQKQNKGDKNKKDDNTMSEGKDNNAEGTVDAHVGKGHRTKIRQSFLVACQVLVHTSLMSPKSLSYQHNVYKISWQHIQ